MENIPVTKTFLPPQAEYESILQRAWNKGWITNRGELVRELEQELVDHLGVNDIILTTNGTLPIQVAIKAMELTGEIITTPFSYVATTAAISWENCKPVFVDIHPDYLTIDETKIEDAITSKTSAILATHVYGNPCHIEVIESVAKKNNLMVIYDAAHCFSVTYKGKSVFNYGDVSTCSFHATKLFHSGEGGALFCNHQELFSKLYYHHNFGHDGPLDFHGLGINCKMSELQAAMGLTILPHMDYVIAERKRAVEFYNDQLNLTEISTLKIREGTQWNYSYYPIILESEEVMLKIQHDLNAENIFPRRYFYPSLNKLPYVKPQSMPVSEDLSSRVLCLPLYVGLTADDLNRIVGIINSAL